MPIFPNSRAAGAQTHLVDRVLPSGKAEQGTDRGSQRKTVRIPKPPRYLYHQLTNYLKAFLILVPVTIVCGVLNERFGLTNIALIFLLPVLMAAVFWGRGPSLIVSVLGTMVFDFFFVRPPFNFFPQDPRDFVVLGVFVVVALVTGTMATRLRREAEKSRIAGLYNRSLIESSLDPLIIVSPEGKISDVNAAAEKITGLSREGLVGQDFTMFFTDQDKAGQIYQLALKNGAAYNYEIGIKHVDGRVTPVVYNASVFRDENGQPAGIFAAARDVTDLKRAEDELRRSGDQLRALSAHIQSVREEERTSLARDIHDELGQVLTGLKLDLSRLSRKPPEDKALLSEEVKSMEGLIDETIKVVRRISTDLRPGVLDDLGLVAALEWQTEEFQKRTSVECDLAQNIDDGNLDPELSTAIFRILQEALTNVARHSQATHVAVTIEEEEGFAKLTVEDDGIGISEEEAFHPDSLGLLGMKERARLFGGEVMIDGITGGGTTLRAVIPLLRKNDNA